MNVVMKEMRMGRMGVRLPDLFEADDLVLCGESEKDLGDDGAFC